MRNIKDVLVKIGLTEGEIEVYLALLEIGISTTGNITKKSGISSSKVYEVLGRLVRKGLASYVIQNGKQHYSATSAERLIDFLEDKKSDIREAQKEVKKLIPEIEEKRKKKDSAEAVIYRGRKGPIIALKIILEEGKKGNETIGFGTDEDDYVKYFPAQLDDYFKDKKREGGWKERLLFAEGFKSPNKTAKVRYLPKEFFSPVRTMVAGDKVCIVDFTEPMTTIVIEKEHIAKSYMEHFNLLWKMAKK